MYITHAYFKNCGAIEDLFLAPTFNNNGTPQPLILVGENGSGKTIILSHIADSFVELAKREFENVTLPTGLHTPYFRVVGAINLRHNAEGYCAIIEYQNEDAKYHYCEHLNEPKIEEKIKEKFSNLHYPPPDIKHVTLTDKKTIEEIFRKNIFLFFPDSRIESSFWFNTDFNTTRQIPSLKQKFQHKLQYPLVVEEIGPEIYAWLVDVFLDARVDLPITPPQIRSAILLQQAVNNVNRILAHILDDGTANISVNFRNRDSRFSVRTYNNSVVYPLANLSAGQKALFSLFCSILMIADRNNIEHSIKIDDIQGVVVIDEIDKHIHNSLAYEAIPKLIASFPKVQFFITTHSPAFILGMQKLYGGPGFDVIEMPTGRKINPEEFSEFQKSITFYQETKAFQQAIQAKIVTGKKPLIFTEGDTDSKYIETFLEISGNREIIDRIEIECVGNYENGNVFFGGRDALNQTRNLFKANPQLLYRKLLLLYDGDTNKSNENIGDLAIRSLPLLDGKKAKKGIENLLSDDVFTEDYYKTETKSNADGGECTIKTLQKTALCSGICSRKDPVDFENFIIS